MPKSKNKKDEPTETQKLLGKVGNVLSYACILIGLIELGYEAGLEDGRKEK